jgi:uncharacterized membrane protein HdeD (DUF308 family)
MSEQRQVIVDEDVADAAADALHEAGKSWWIVLALGAISIVLGIMFLVWPQATVTVFAVIFGLYLLVSGIVQLVQGFNKELTSGERTLSVVIGVISIALGIMCFRGGIANGVEILGLFVGFSFLFRGIYQLIFGIQNKGAEGRGLMIFAGVLGVIVGIVFLVAPFESITLLAMIAGIWLIVLGLIEIFYSFKVKKATGN